MTSLRCPVPVRSSISVVAFLWVRWLNPGRETSAEFFFTPPSSIAWLAASSGRTSLTCLCAGYPQERVAREDIAARDSYRTDARWPFQSGEECRLLLWRDLLLVMPHVAAGVTTAIPAVEGLQSDDGLGALTLGTEGTRIGLPTITVVRLTHSYVPGCAHVRLRRSARVARRRSIGPVRRLNACCSFGLRGQQRSHVRQCQERTTSPRQIPNAGTRVPAERQKAHRRGTNDHISISFAMTPFRCCCTTGPAPWREDTPVRVPTRVAERRPACQWTPSPVERMAAISQGADQQGDRWR